MSDFDSNRLTRIGEALDADVASGKIPGAVVLVARNEALAYQYSGGFRDRGLSAPMRPDAIFRGASMTKPVVAVAALQLVEEGKLQLWDPVAAYLPKLGKVKVGVERTDGDGLKVLDLVPPARPITVQDLFRHTAGFTYGPLGTGLVHAAYRTAGVGDPRDTNEEMVRKLAAVPLAFHPGSTFEYGMSIDVLGRICEVVDGRELDAVLAHRVLEPLQMKDTAFALPAEKRDRFAEGNPNPGTVMTLNSVFNPDAQPRWYAGGSGLVTTAQDFYRFATALLRGGELDGVRLLARKTVALMTSNHLPPGCGYGPFTRLLGITAPLPEYGQGFGLGVNVRIEAGRNPCAGSAGDFCWSGISGTYFWVDPLERIVAVLMLQAPELRVHYRALLRDLVYGALN